MPDTRRADYLNRVVDREVAETLASSPAVLIEGPRGCGKTWTGQSFANSEVVLDGSEALRIAAEVDPDSILDGEEPRLLDEWHLVRSIWNPMRHACDRRGGFRALPAHRIAESTRRHHRALGGRASRPHTNASHVLVGIGGLQRRSIPSVANGRRAVSSQRRKAHHQRRRISYQPRRMAPHDQDGPGHRSGPYARLPRQHRPHRHLPRFGDRAQPAASESPPCVIGSQRKPPQFLVPLCRTT